MTMVSLKVTKAEREAEKKKYENKSGAICGPMGDEYGYGLRVRLDDRALSKLGLDVLPAVGKKMTMTAKVSVTETESRTSEGGEPRRNVELQITAMELSGGDAVDAVMEGIAEANDD